MIIRKLAAPTSISEPRGRVLLIIKTEGSLATNEIAKKLGVTMEAARQLLVKLGAEGLVQWASDDTGKRGRPAARWKLTEEGHQLFPDGHSDVAVQLLRSIEDRLGPVALQQVIDARATEVLANYRRALHGSVSLEEKLQRLTSIRTEEGYLADYQATETGFLFIENHCPICAAAQTCQGFCSAELSVFQELLGPDVTVERIDHIVAGARRCAYTVCPIT